MEYFVLSVHSSKKKQKQMPALSLLNNAAHNFSFIKNKNNCVAKNEGKQSCASYQCLWDVFQCFVCLERVQKFWLFQLLTQKGVCQQLKV